MAYGISKEGFSRLSKEAYFIDDYDDEWTPPVCPECGSKDLDDISNSYEYGSKKWTEHNLECLECGRVFPFTPRPGFRPRF